MSGNTAAGTSDFFSVDYHIYTVSNHVVKSGWRHKCSYDKNAHCVGRRSLETLGFSFEKLVIVMRILKTNLAVSDTERIDLGTWFGKWG